MKMKDEIGMTRAAEAAKATESAARAAAESAQLAKAAREAKARAKAWAAEAKAWAAAPATETATSTINKTATIINQTKEQTMTNPKTIKIGNDVYIRQCDIAAQKPSGPESIFRTRSAGVHVGTLKSRSGTEATILNARRLWCWVGAFTLNEAALYGVTRESSRISATVPEILLTEVIEIIPIAEGVDLSTTEKA